MRKTFYFRTLVALLLIMLVAVSAFAEPWKFGVMADTQWPTSPDGKNPNVAVNVVRHLNQEFINHGVKFVIQTGDLTDTGGTNSINMDVRATFAQDLYNAGIGFYPLRGNHESTAANAVRFQQIFPQTQTCVNNQTPNMVSTTIYGPQTNTNGTFCVGSNFTTEPTYDGLTYSFTYDNARFVLIDQFTKPAGTAHSNLDATDVAWVGTALSSKPAGGHAFSFGHKGLITENHNDNMFNSTNPTASTASKNLMESFMQILQNNGVRYHMGGHDHMHNRAIVSSPNTGNYKVQNIINASNSYKFYIPPTAATLATQTWRSLETQIAQEIFGVGYYIVTVDGPKVTVDYYAMPNGCNGDCDETYDNIPYLGNTPTYNGLFSTTVPFTKHETFGYSLNGKEVLVPQGGSYALTDDTTKAVANGETGYIGTSAAILSGTNGSTGRDYSGRALTKTVDTGWAPADAETASDILTLWGMADSLATNFSDLGNSNYHYKYVVPDTNRTYTFVLSMSYDPTDVTDEMISSGRFGISIKDDVLGWVSAISRNVGGTSTFVVGPWVDGDSLGTFGVDPVTNTAWAVINNAGDFAVAVGEPAFYTPELISPAGHIATTTPTYTWNAVSGANSYDLYTNIGGVGTTTNYTAAAANCESGTGNCTITSPDLSNGASVFWAVRAKNVFGNSPYSTGLTFIVGLAPTTPVLVAPSGNIATTTPTYTWNAVSGASSYDLYTNIGGVGTTTNYTAAAANCESGTGNCTITSPDLSNGTSVSWAVRAKNVSGNTPYSTGLTFIVGLAPTTPVLVAPSGNIATTTPTYTWNAVSGASSYDLYTKIGGVGTTTNYTAAAANCESGTGNCTITSPDLSNGTSVSWAVRAKNVSGNTPYSTGLTFIVGLAPTTPVLVAPSGNIATTTPTYTWNAVSGASSYDLYTNIGGVGTTTNYTAAAANCESGTGNCTITSPDLPTGTYIFWAVRAKNVSGNTPYSTGLTFKIQ